jgi:hypothetical protein
MSNDNSTEPTTLPPGEIVSSQTKIYPDRLRVSELDIEGGLGSYVQMGNQRYKVERFSLVDGINGYFELVKA